MPVSADLNNGSVLGVAAEDPVRQAFAKKLAPIRANAIPPLKPGEPYNLGKAASAKGSDVMWTEIAEMYAELARITNDEFLAELANELATLR